MRCKAALFLVPPGRQYIKEMLVDGQSHLLVIREETGPPDAQVTATRWLWVSGSQTLRTTDLF